MRNQKKSGKFLVILTLGILLPLLISGQLNASNDNLTALKETTLLSPSTGAMGQVNVFPGQNEELNVNSSYTFSAGLRDETNMNAAYDGGYMTVTKSGDVYANESFLPLGSYNSTYSFQNDLAGGLAAGFAYAYGPGGSAAVVDSFLGHSKVLSISTTSITGTSTTAQLSITSSTGNVSCWVCSSSDAYNAYVYLPILGNNVANLAMMGGWFRYWNVTNWYDTATRCMSNRWYYCRVSFTPSQVKWYIDEILIATIPVGASASSLHFGSTPNAGVPYTAYYDAIDVSYSNVYAYPNLEDLSSIGKYNATYSFEDDASLTFPANWGDMSGSGCRAYVLPGPGCIARDHHNILCFEDFSGSTLSAVSVSFGLMKTSGAVEFWQFTSNVATDSYITLRDGFFNSYISTYISGGVFWYAAGVISTSTGISVTASTWYHHRIQWTASNVFDWYVNGVKIVSGGAVENASATPCFFVPETSVTGWSYLMGIDAVDFSWDSQYGTERSTYVQLQQNMTFSEEGSYSFRYTLTGSGTDHAGSWTPFSVVVPEVPPVPEYTILFSTSSADLLGVPVDAAFLSIDGVSQAWGPVELLNGTHNITVRDYFGDVLFSQNVTFVAGGSYSIPLTLATLVINNYQGEPLSVELTKTGCSGTFRQLVGAQDSIVIRLASATYRVRAYNRRGDLVGEHASVILAPGANQQADFGTPEGPFTLEWMILVGILALCAILLVVANARIGGKGGRDEYLSLERAPKEDKHAKMAAYVAPEAKVPAPATLAAKAPAPKPPVAGPQPPVTPKPEVKPASAAEKLSPIDPRREFIKQIDKDIDFLYAMVRTLDAQFGQGQITNDLYLQQKNAAAEKIGELMGKKEQFLSEKPKA